MQRLELTWIGKGENPEVEPRILIHDPSMDYGDPDTGNMLIHGDNLLVLKALEQDFAGKIKCIYIDPPFNTGARIDADGNEIGYEDGIEHSIWLNLMAERLRIMRRLLSEDGAIFIHLDDNESDYCKVIADEIFGRRNFMNRITVDSRSPSAFSTVNPGVFKAAEYILFYAKNRSLLVESPVRIKRDPDYAYDKFIVNIDDEYSQWRYIALSDAYSQFSEQAKGSRKTKNPKQASDAYNTFIIDNAHRIFRFTAISDKGAGKATVELKYRSLDTPDTILRLERQGLDDVYVLNGQQITFYSKNIVEIDGQKCASRILTDIWSDIAWEGIASEGGVTFKKGKKPERLIKRCLELVTKPGDIVLDSFLGSGTTAAVAQKMHRRYIGIELGPHCYTHSRARLMRVVDGDQTGISKIVDWHGGGGFTFYELAPSLICADGHGNPVISDSYNTEMLVASVVKLNGYRLAPNDDAFWKQGYSQDKSYIYVTTQYLTADMLDGIASDMGPMESLLVCAPAFDLGLNKRYDNITVKKIPQSVLDKCEYGVDNYNLNVIDLPVCDDEEWEDD